jgi:methylthioribose-1-phosphate isomerase
MAIPRSVEWKEDSIKILNQQLIPNSVEFLTLETIEDVWDAIKTLKVRGAPAIGIAAAFGLALAGSKFEGEDLQEFHTHIREKSLYVVYKIKLRMRLLSMKQKQILFMRLF